MIKEGLPTSVLVYFFGSLVNVQESVSNKNFHVRSTIGKSIFSGIPPAQWGEFYDIKFYR